MHYIILINPPRLSTVAINEKIEANTSLGFVYNSTQVTIYYTAPIKTTCSVNIFIVRGLQNGLVQKDVDVMVCPPIAPFW